MITDVPAAISQSGITGTIEITVQGAANPVLYDIVTSPTTQPRELDHVVSLRCFSMSYNKIQIMNL